jgi:hypothetical protein
VCGASKSRRPVLYRERQLEGDQPHRCRSIIETFMLSIFDALRPFKRPFQFSMFSAFFYPDSCPCPPGLGTFSLTLLHKQCTRVSVTSLQGNECKQGFSSLQNRDNNNNNIHPTAAAIGNIYSTETAFTEATSKLLRFGYHGLAFAFVHEPTAEGHVALVIPDRRGCFVFVSPLFCFLFLLLGALRVSLK